MSESYPFSYFEAFQSLIRKLEKPYVDDALSEAENAFSDASTTYSGPPMPMTCHPAFTQFAGFVRNRTQGEIRLPVIGKLRAFLQTENTKPEEPVSMKMLTVTRRKVCAPAPFVGDPRLVTALYAWPVWIDDHGRYISGEAELVWDR